MRGAGCGCEAGAILLGLLGVGAGCAAGRESKVRRGAGVIVIFEGDLPGFACEGWDGWG